METETPATQQNLEFMAEDQEEQTFSKDLAKNSRMGFIKKVFGIVAVMFTCTAGFVVIPVYSMTMREFCHTTWGIVILVLCILNSLVLMYALGCYNAVARKVPLNYILLGLFTLCQSYCVAFITAYYTPESVLFAAI